eukprot:2549727-Pyramimonas_sp.AAC.1
MKGNSRFRCGRAPNHNRSPILRRQAQACPERSAAGALRRSVVLGSESSTPSVPIRSRSGVMARRRARRGGALVVLRA